MKLIIDAHNMLHRMYWQSQKTILTNTKGEDIGCVFKCLKSLFSLAKRFRPNGFYIVWDKRELKENYRTTLTEGTYKAGRDKTNQHEILQNERKLLPVVCMLGFKNLFPRILEADDIIAWLVNKLKGTEVVTIVSCDKDFLQLVQPNVQVYNPVLQQLYTIDNFEKLLKVQPKDYLRYKAMIGDPADNLKRPELKGIGPKTAINVINGKHKLTEEQSAAVTDLMHLMSLEDGFKDHPEELTHCEDQYKISQAHVTDFEAFKAYCTENDFKSILRSFDEWKSVFSPNRLVDLINSLI